MITWRWQNKINFVSTGRGLRGQGPFRCKAATKLGHVLINALPGHHSTSSPKTEHAASTLPTPDLAQALTSSWTQVSDLPTHRELRFYFRHSLLGAAEEYAPWMTVVVRTKFKHTILSIYGSRYDATKGSGNPLA